jgi:hypothetical protein
MVDKIVGVSRLAVVQCELVEAKCCSNKQQRQLIWMVVVVGDDHKNAIERGENDASL